jgi:GNAT superfamily N-acetyltransferase
LTDSGATPPERAVADASRPPLRIEHADPCGSAALALLREAEVEARALYRDLIDPTAPPATNAPLGPRSAFVVARLGDDTVACGSIRPLDASAAEVRRMYVQRRARRIGVARALLQQLELAARQLGYDVLRLETGNRQAAAMALYASCGFERIPAFGVYADDPTSICFEKRLGPTNIADGTC